MAELRFRPASELPENPPDGMRILAKVKQECLIDRDLVFFIWDRFTNKKLQSRITAWIPESELLQAAEEAK